MKININSIDYHGSIVDGPGVRTVIFLQGCDKRCEGCHNPSTWDLHKGNLIELNDLINELNSKCMNKKVTISGGEPLLQYSEVLHLVKSLNKFDIALYTGLDFNDVPAEILNYLNYIKVGPYQKDKRTTIIPYIGSKNQNFLTLNKKVKKNEIN
jgi:anaerobic ribonucleoside-triphosphate reductase activating protein